MNHSIFHRFAVSLLIVPVLLLSIPGAAQEPGLRAPAYPLIVCNPYFSFWSFADHPGTDWTRHWTGSTMGMSSLVKIDSTYYRLLGLAGGSRIKPMPLLATKIFPTKTEYTFEVSGCRLVMTFLNPMLPWDLSQLSKSLGYISWTMESIDGQSHTAKLYYDCSAEPAVNAPSQKINWSRVNVKGLEVMAMGSADQQVLQKSGDDLRIDWGYLYLASSKSQHLQSVIGGAVQVRNSFLTNGKLPEDDDMRMPRSASDEWPVMAWCSSTLSVETSATELHLILAYDEGYSAEFLNRKLLPYWKSKGETTAGMLANAESGYSKMKSDCELFDQNLIADLTNAGGKEYCDLAVLAYRQALGAYSLSADADGTMYHFPKENFSNGCISTVDVIYPASPILLFSNPELLKADLEPILRYIETGRWKFPFAPHDLGTYPLANGQVYGGAEISEDDQMPVEETANMLIMMYAICFRENSGNYAAKHFPVLEAWARYLLEKGLDPENQLCTDDFAGHLAHNTNLSLKAILGLEAFSRSCKLMGKSKEAANYHLQAEAFATKWKQMASDKDHYRLSFDKPDTWSQKYNLVWDKVLDMNLFPDEIAETEIRFYMNHINTFGLPLDNRADYTKADWLVWTATLSKEQDSFQKLIHPLWLFANTTTDRVPFSDWYDTKTAKQVGFQARSVIGGVYMKMLSDKELWQKWNSGRLSPICR